VSKYGRALGRFAERPEEQIGEHHGEGFRDLHQDDPERLWEAITDPEIRSKYTFGARISSDWRPGSRYEMSAPKADGLLGEGEILEVDPPRRLVRAWSRSGVTT